MNLITDNLSPDKDGGKIIWNGEETKILKEKFRSNLGFMPQQQNLYDNMTAFDFLGYVAALKALDKKKTIVANIVWVFLSYGGIYENFNKRQKCDQFYAESGKS